MKSFCFALAALAAMGFAGAAYAGDAATAPKAMSDSDMDKVTAGGATVINPGQLNMGIVLPKGAQATQPHASGRADGHPPTFCHPTCS